MGNTASSRALPSGCRSEAPFSDHEQKERQKYGHCSVPGDYIITTDFLGCQICLRENLKSVSLLLVEGSLEILFSRSLKRFKVRVSLFLPQCKNIFDGSVPSCEAAASKT